jgi:protein gp37
VAIQGEHGISWTDVTWNPIRGCTRVSEGCRNCYAEGVAARFSKPGQAYEGLAGFKILENGERDARWTGKVRFVEEHLLDPLRWRKPRRVFVNSMSDLFHEEVKIEWIAKIFNIMASATTECGKRHKHKEECWTGPGHTYQILTKRPERMKAMVTEELPQFASEYMPGDCALSLAMEMDWPLPNVWLGTSVEDQATADARIPALLSTPAAVRFISAEPLLGPLELREEWYKCPAKEPHPGVAWCPCLGWVIVGGESGAGARPFHIEWARNLKYQCMDACIPLFIKQLGAHPQEFLPNTLRPMGIRLDDRKGGDWNEWPADLRVREFPE